jgi:hypothetical protein
MGHCHTVTLNGKEIRRKKRFDFQVLGSREEIPLAEAGMGLPCLNM